VETLTLKKDILVVDDDSIANFLIERIVTSTGFVRNIQKALNGKQALEIFENNLRSAAPVPEVVLLDLNMPIMNGFEFIRAFRAMEFSQKQNTLIILVTSSSNPADIATAKQLGIKYYLTKPLSADRLKEIFLTEFPDS
jgi:CheY-like chemotaxis protein